MNAFVVNGLIALAAYLVVAFLIFLDCVRRGSLDQCSAFWVSVCWPIIAVIMAVMATGWAGREFRDWRRKYFVWGKR